MISAASILALTLSVSAPLQAAGAAPQPLPPDRPFADILRNLGRDLKALPSADTALVLGIGGGGAVVLYPLDDNISQWVKDQGPASYTKVGRVVGEGWVQAGIAVGAYAIGRAGHHPRTAHVGADLIRGQMLTGLLTQTLKVTVNRTRPSGGHHSFPSGHASASFLTAAVFQTHYGWQAGLPAYALAGYVGWTRIRDDMHFLSDVIVGATIGIVVGRTVTAGHRERSWSVTPTATAGGLAVFASRAWGSRPGGLRLGARGSGLEVKPRGLPGGAKSTARRPSRGV